MNKVSQPKPKSEQKVRAELMSYAKTIGAAEDLEQLFQKWDTAVALASPDEQVDMARMAILEVQKLLDIYPDDGLTINGEIVIAPSKEKHDQVVVPVAVRKKVD